MHHYQQKQNARHRIPPVTEPNKSLLLLSNQGNTTHYKSCYLTSAQQQQPRRCSRATAPENFQRRSKYAIRPKPTHVQKPGASAIQREWVAYGLKRGQHRDRDKDGERCEPRDPAIQRPQQHTTTISPQKTVEKAAWTLKGDSATSELERRRRRGGTRESSSHDSADN